MSIRLYSSLPQADQLGKMPELISKADDVMKEFTNFLSAYNIK